ncbi:hypothetical protein N657DRAFT_647523 [Parathielavia appendiculata]|uniref:Uncharacterized protein n=1 Tax=Parathielavia appendiculata TaxID=2587402 RepID=A0AAN6TXF3_9PEZI|nr:hypothetical protein N657DRAFT_647523 [Parathielavia appendiculata]
MQRSVSRLGIGVPLRKWAPRSNFPRRVAFTTTSISLNAMSRRAWLNPDGPTGKPIGLVNPINAPETGNEIWIHETPLPVATMARFVEFLSNHKLSDGQVTTIPTLSPSDVAKFLQPYNDWAPAPYNNNPIPSDAAVNRFGLCLTGLPDMLDFEAMFSSGGFWEPTKIDFELEICRQRLWTGMVPLSDRRWAEKKLDSPENIDLAVEYLLKTCDMIHFSLPVTFTRARQAYNKGYDVFVHFDTVLDAYYATTLTTPRPIPVPRLADLWAEFYFSHVKFITNRIHTWAASRVDSIADAMIHRSETAPALPGAADMSPEQEALFTQFHRLSHIIRRLDEMILFPLVGFKNTLPHWQHATSPPTVDWPEYILSHGATPLGGNYPVDIVQRDEVYYQRLANLVRQELTLAASTTDAGNDDVDAFSGERVAEPLRCVRAAYAQGRRDLRGEAEPVQEEMWIGALRRSMESQSEGRPPVYTKWGFVAYRVWYGHSDEQWAAFLRKFEADVNSWGPGVAGAEAVKEKLEIRWVDGRDYGIAEGDVEGARRHFRTLHEKQGARLHGLNAPAFLVADKSCIDSYIYDFVLPGQTLMDEADMGPFILVGREEVGGSGREAPGFEGTVRVLGSVLLDDVWPCLWWRHVEVEDMWNLATWHPSCVYSGPVVQSQVKGWKRLHRLRDELLKKADEWHRHGRLN